MSNWNTEIFTIKSLFCHGIATGPYSRIAIFVNQGIEFLVLEASAKATQIFRRQFVAIDSTNPLDKWLRDVDNKILWKGNIYDLKEMSMLPEGLSLKCKIPHPATVENFALSPIYRNESYLAVVTSTCSAVVYSFTGGSWVINCDISKLWLEHCTPNWSPPTSFSEWKTQLHEGKPHSICWLTESNKLYLIMCLHNGCVAIFEEGGQNIFEMRLKTSVQSNVVDPSCIHATAMPKPMSCELYAIIAVGSCNGSLTALHLSNWKLSKIDVPWTQHDYAAPLSCTSYDNQLIVNKTQFVLVLTITSHGAIQTKEISLKSNISNISAANSCLYVTLSNHEFVEYSLPSLTERSRCLLSATATPDNPATCSYAVVSDNGLIQVVATNSSDHSSISVKVSSDNPLHILQKCLSDGGSLADYIDVLWAYKVSLRKNEKKLKAAGWDPSFPQLRYWQLHYLLHIVASDDEALTSLQKHKKEVDELLAASYFKGKPALQATLDAIQSGKSVEKCALCEDVCESSLTETTCKNGHRLRRCCFTLRPCVSAYYKTCSLCAAIDVTGINCAKQEKCYFCGGSFRFIVPLL